MMKKTVQFVPIIAIAIAGTMFSCVDSGKDLYDPSMKHLTRWETALLLPMISIGT